MTSRKKIVNIALQGGGAHGAFAWGILDRLLEDGRIHFDGIASASAGSMNAVALAYGLTVGGVEGARETLHNFWYDVSHANASIQAPLTNHFAHELKRMGFSIFDAASKIISPYQFNPFNINLLKNVLVNRIDFEHLRSKKAVNLFISATNVRTGKVRVFTKEELSIDVILASACLPYLFHAVKIEEDYYWDGGFMGNPPIFPLFYHGNTKDVIIVHINPIVRTKLPITANEIMNRINEITFNSSLMKEMRAIAFVEKLIGKGWIKKKYQDKLRYILVHSIRADQALQSFDVSTKFNSDWSFLTYLRDLGRIEASNWLATNYKNIGKKSTVDLKQDFLGQGNSISED